MDIDTRIRIAAIIIKDKKLLLLKGIGYQELWTPGGKVEPGETDEDCLRREIKEEIGVELFEMKFFKQYDRMSFYNPEKRLKQIVYLVKIKGEIKPDAEIESFLRLSREDYDNGKYITKVEDETIQDLIKENIF